MDDAATTYALIKTIEASKLVEAYLPYVRCDEPSRQIICAPLKLHVHGWTCGVIPEAQCELYSKRESVRVQVAHARLWAVLCDTVLLSNISVPITQLALSVDDQIIFAWNNS